MRPTLAQIAALFALDGLACSAAHMPAATVGTPAVPSGPTLPAEAPSRLIRLAPEGPPRVVGRGSDGTEWLLAGGYRLARRVDGRVAGAEQSTAETLVWALRAGARWRFGTAHAALESDGFTGGLREVPLAAPGRPCRGTGRACSVRAGELAGVALPARGVVIDAAFADDAHGVVVFEPGSAFATDDGGGTWWPVALAGDAGLAAAADDSGRWVRGAASAAQVGEGGAARAMLREAMPWPVAAGTAETTPEGGEGGLWPGDAARALYAAALSGARSGERVLLAVRGGLYDYDPRTEELAPAGPHPCGDPAVLPGTGGAVLCAGAGGPEVWAAGDGGRWERKLALAPGVARCRGGTETSWLGCQGGCAPGPASAARVCEESAVTPQRAELVAHGEIVGYEADGARWSLVAESLGAGGAGGELIPAARVRLARDGRVVPAMDAWLPGAGAGVLLEPWPALGAEGALRVVARDASGRWGILDGRAGGTFVFRPGPERARWVGVAPGGTTVAFVPGAGWAQADEAAAEFHPVAAVDAAAARWMAAGPGAGAACGEAGCRLDAQRARVGFGPVATSRFSALAFAVEGPGAGAEVDTAGGWRCRAEGMAVRVPDADSVGTTAGEQLFVLDGPSGHAMVQERAASDGVRVRASWFPLGVAGLATVRETSFTLPRYYDPGAASATRWTALALRAHAAVFSRCGAGPGGAAPGCDVVVVRSLPSGVGAASVPSQWARTTRPPAAVAGAEGEIALLTEGAEAPGGEVETPGEPRELAFFPRFAPARTGDVALAREAPGAVGVYVLDGEAGVARVLLDGSLVLAPPGGLPRTMAGFESGERPGACGPFARGEIALSTRGVLDLGDQGSRELVLTARYGVEQGALCLRGIDGDVRQFGPAGWLGARPGPGAGAGAGLGPGSGPGPGSARVLLGTARTRGRIMGVRCEPPAGVQP